jgi:hypothetical protein
MSISFGLFLLLRPLSPAVCPKLNRRIIDAGCPFPFAVASPMRQPVRTGLCTTPAPTARQRTPYVRATVTLAASRCDAMVSELPGSSYTDDAYSEAPMDAPRRVFRIIQLGGDWYWRLDIMNDDGLIGPFMSRDEAEKDAQETLGITEGEVDR